MTDLYRCTPRQIKTFVTEIIYADLVPYVHSSPGMGKSSIYKSIAKENNLHLIDHRLSTSAPEDMSGLPKFENSKAVFVPFADLFPLQSTPLPAGKDGWMLFLDEFNAGSKEVQSAAYKLILDRMTGQHSLHPNVVLCAAGNLLSDRAITNPLGTAMQSRLVHLEMEINFVEWLEDVAIKESYDSRIIAYLSQYPSKLMDFNPDHSDKTFCCPRTWEFLNRLIKDKEVHEKFAPMYAGTITSGVAIDFIQFTKVFHTLIKLEEVLKDPENCRVPTDNSSKWATVSSFIEKITVDNFDKLATYANRFSLDFRILFFRAALLKHSKLRHHPALIQAMSNLSNYLHEA